MGRESDTILNYIIENYDNIPDYVAFTQGGIDDHSWFRSDWGPEMFINMIQEAEKQGFSNYHVFNSDMNPEWTLKIDYETVINYDKSMINNYTNFSDFLKRIDIYDEFYEDHINNRVKIHPSAFMVISKKHILSREKSYYEKIINYCNYNINPIEGHYFERSWAYIFNCHK